MIEHHFKKGHQRCTARIHCDPDQLHIICYRYSILITLKDDFPQLLIRDSDEKDEDKEILFEHDSQMLSWDETQ
jgi:hypothetical protein